MTQIEGRRPFQSNGLDANLMLNLVKDWYKKQTMKGKNKGIRPKQGKTFVFVPLRFTGFGNRIICPECNNDRDFFEVANNVTITTRYVQNADGSFTPKSDESTINGDIHLFCGECYADLSQYYQRFSKMIF